MEGKRKLILSKKGVKDAGKEFGVSVSAKAIEKLNEYLLSEIAMAAQRSKYEGKKTIMLRHLEKTGEEE